EDDRLRADRVVHRELVGEGQGNAQWDRPPEVLAVEADRLGDELADRSLAGRQRWRELTQREPRARRGEWARPRPARRALPRSATASGRARRRRSTRL